MKLLIHVDGGARGNPGPAGAGVTIQDAAGRRQFEAGFFLGRMTNNQAEYQALLKALEFVARCRPAEVCIRADSELLVRQINGDYRVRNPDLARLYEAAMATLRTVPKWSMQHVRRESNSRADELANLAMDRGKDVILLDAAAESHGTPQRSALHGPPPDSAKSVAPSFRPAAAPPPVVRARCTTAPARRACPAACRVGQEFIFRTTIPPGICLSVARPLLEAVLAAQGGRQEPQEVICPTPGCRARFVVAAVPSAPLDPPA